MKQAAQNLRKKIAELSAAIKADAIENSRFVRLMSEVPRNQLLGMGALTGLGATGLVVNGAELLTPAEAEAVLTGEALADDRDAGYGMLLSAGLTGAGVGLTGREYYNRMLDEEARLLAERDELAARRAARTARGR